MRVPPFNPRHRTPAGRTRQPRPLHPFWSTRSASLSPHIFISQFATNSDQLYYVVKLTKPILAMHMPFNYRAHYNHTQRFRCVPRPFLPNPVKASAAAHMYNSKGEHSPRKVTVSLSSLSGSSTMLQPKQQKLGQTCTCVCRNTPRFALALLAPLTASLSLRHDHIRIKVTPCLFFLIAAFFHHDALAPLGPGSTTGRSWHLRLRLC